MKDAEVRGVLLRATEHLTDPRPDLLADVRRAGRRRVLRRRTALAGGLAVIVSASVGGLSRLSGAGERLELAAPFFDQPTRGNLAGDDGFLRQLSQVWQRRMADIDVGLRGVPHVVWAGDTPAGPAGYLIQRTLDNPVVSEPDGDRLVAVAAFIESTAGGLRLMTVEQVSDSGLDGNSQAVLLGPDRDVLLVLDVGQAVEFSPELRYTDDGRARRTFRPVVFRDGAAVLPVPPQRTRVTVALSRTPVGRWSRLHISNTSEILFPKGRERPTPSMIERTLPGAERVWGDDPKAVIVRYVDEPGSLAEYYDEGGMHISGTTPMLTGYGATPDGRLLLVMTMQYDGDPARAVALLGPVGAPLRPVVGALVDWTAALPVRLRLPDGQGTVVVAVGAGFSYRVEESGGWRDAGRDVALLPAAAVELRVTPASGAASDIPLR